MSLPSNMCCSEKFTYFIIKQCPRLLYCAEFRFSRLCRLQMFFFSHKMYSEFQTLVKTNIAPNPRQFLSPILPTGILPITLYMFFSQLISCLYNGKEVNWQAREPQTIILYNNKISNNKVNRPDLAWFFLQRGSLRINYLIDKVPPPNC